MMSLSTRPLLRIVALAAMLLAGTGIYILLQTQKAHSQQIGASESLLTHFSVLSTSAESSADPLSPAGVVASPTHKIVTDDPSLQQWMAARGDDACVLESDSDVSRDGTSPAYACASLTPGKVENELVVMGAGALPHSAGTRPSGPLVLVGLAPNGVTSVLITYSDGTSDIARVLDNGFHALSDGRRPAAFTWMTVDGKTHVQNLGNA